MVEDARIAFISVAKRYGVLILVEANLGLGRLSIVSEDLPGRRSWRMTREGVGGNTATVALRPRSIFPPLDPLAGFSGGPQLKAVRNMSAVWRSKACGSSASGRTGCVCNLCAQSAGSVHGKSKSRCKAARSKAFVITSFSKRLRNLLARKANSKAFRTALIRQRISNAVQGFISNSCACSALLHQEKFTYQAQKMVNEALSSCNTMLLRNMNLSVGCDLLNRATRSTNAEANKRTGPRAA
mmetsp:Transcript_87829/g.174345  ORF Transcript_87829/g.174345 Transcript_87829/m.174345 type:complete len:241 (+) Transcript_87829:1682-2404(+)